MKTPIFKVKKLSNFWGVPTAVKKQKIEKRLTPVRSGTREVYGNKCIKKNLAVFITQGIVKSWKFLAVAKRPWSQVFGMRQATVKRIPTYAQ